MSVHPYLYMKRSLHPYFKLVFFQTLTFSTKGVKARVTLNPSVVTYSHKALNTADPS